MKSASLVLAWLALSLVVVPRVRADYETPLFPRTPAILRVSLGSGGGALLGRDGTTDTPNGVGVQGRVGVVLPYHLYLGVDLRWFAGTREPAAVPLHYRSFRTTAEIGVEIGEHHVHFRPYLGVGHALYRLVLGDYAVSRSAAVVAPGFSVLFGGVDGFFGGFDASFPQVIHRDHGETLAPTRGHFDSSLDVFLYVGWAFRCPALEPANRASAPETVGRNDD